MKIQGIFIQGDNYTINVMRPIHVNAGELDARGMPAAAIFGQAKFEINQRLLPNGTPVLMHRAEQSVEDFARALLLALGVYNDSSTEKKPKH